jgi:hypothetical protein
MRAPRVRCESAHFGYRAEKGFLPITLALEPQLHPAGVAATGVSAHLGTPPPAVWSVVDEPRTRDGSREHPIGSQRMLWISSEIDRS